MKPFLLALMMGVCASLMADTPTPSPTATQTPTYYGLTSASRVKGTLRPAIPDAILFAADCSFDYAVNETTVVITVWGTIGLEGIKAYTTQVGQVVADAYKASNAQVILDNAPKEEAP